MERYNGLDLLRCILMLLGPLIHIIAVIDPRGNWRYFSDDYSNLLTHSLFYPITFFRMETFFIISGFLSLLVILRKSSKYYFVSRKERVLVPFIFSILTLSPLCYYLNFYIYSFFDVNITNTILHLWFLLTLFIVSCLYLFFFKFLNIIFESISLISLIFISFIFLVFNEVLLNILRKILSDEIFRIYFYFIYNTLYYSVYFLIGASFYQKWKNIKINLSVVCLVLFYSIIACFSYFSYSINDFIFKSLFKILSIAFGLYASLYFFDLFRKFNIKKNKTVDYLVRNAILVYLFHFPITIFVCYYMDQFLLSDLSYFILCLFLILSLSLFISHWVQKSKLLCKLYGVR